MVMCELDMGRVRLMLKLQVFGRIGGRKGEKKKADAYAEIVLKVEDSQLADMCSHNLETVWDTLAQVHCACGLAMQLVLRRQLLRAWRKLCRPGLAV